MYKFVAKSPSDPNKSLGGLGFNNYDQANRHCEQMNKLIEIYPNGIWNTAFWKSKPEKWEVIISK